MEIPYNPSVLRAHFKKLRSGKVETSPQARGYVLERIVLGLLADAQLEPASNFSREPSNGNVDGSFTFRSRVFLVECKWHKDAIDLDAVDVFAAKVRRRLGGTLGLFVSMSGFSARVAKNWRNRSQSSLLFMNGDDMDQAVDQGIRTVLEAKFSQASRSGLFL